MKTPQKPQSFVSISKVSPYQTGNSWPMPNQFLEKEKCDSANNKHLQVSIIVIVYNAEKTLPECLDSLMNLDFPKDQREIVVVDNNSTDKTKDIIGQYPVTYLFEPNRGRAWARNRGARAARGEFIAFTDADCIVTRDWLKILMKDFEKDRNIAVCGGKIVASKQETTFEKYLKARGVHNQKRGISGQDYIGIPAASTTNLIFRKHILEEVGYFDEDLITYEDTELCWRIALIGYEFRYFKDAIVYHQYKRTFWQFCAHYFEYGMAAVVLNKKCNLLGIGQGRLPMPINLFLALICSLFTSIFSFISFLLTLSKKSKEVMIYSFLEVVFWVSYISGATFFIVRKILLRRKTHLNCKFRLNHLDKNFTFHNNGTVWLLPFPSSWFVHNGFMQLIVFSDGLNIYRFNKTGTKIWQSLIRTGDLKKTVAEISSVYNISQDTAKEDIFSFTTLLEKEGLIKEEKYDSWKRKIFSRIKQTTTSKESIKTSTY